MLLTRSVSVLALAALATGCSSDRFEPPKASADVVAEQTRLAPLVEASQRGSYSGKQGTCAIRLLGQEDQTSYAWASCDFPGDNGGPGGGISTPVRVNGSSVRFPGDGGDFARDVRSTFPSQMVDAILHDPNRLQPKR